MALPKTYKQAVFKAMGEPLIIEEVALKLPGPGEILIKVEACGICHSDINAKYNGFGAGFPVVPGHEIIGKAVAIGDGVVGWNIGDRIGGGWHGGHDGTCDKCKQGLVQFCQPYIANGITRDGGYAEFCLLRAQAAVRVPADIDAAKCAPMLCAGSTVFDALKTAKLEPGETVAVQGLGGLGHMAVQMARKMGYRVVAISRGSEKEKSAKELGAHEYIDATAVDAGVALQKLGYAKLILTTAMSTDAMTPLIKGISLFGKLMILSIPNPGEITVNANELLMGGISVQGWPVANCHVSEKTLGFAHLHGLESYIEKFPLEKAQEAFDAMLNGKVRYRSVITFE